MYIFLFWRARTRDARKVTSRAANSRCRRSSACRSPPLAPRDLFATAGMRDSRIQAAPCPGDPPVALPQRQHSHRHCHPDSLCWPFDDNGRRNATEKLRCVACRNQSAKNRKYKRAKEREREKVRTHFAQPG